MPTFDIGGVGVLQSNKNAPFTYDGGKVHDKKRGYDEDVLHVHVDVCGTLLTCGRSNE